MRNKIVFIAVFFVCISDSFCLYGRWDNRYENIRKFPVGNLLAVINPVANADITVYCSGEDPYKDFYNTTHYRTMLDILDFNNHIDLAAIYKLLTLFRARAQENYRGFSDYLIRSNSASDALIQILNDSSNCYSRLRKRYNILHKAYERRRNTYRNARTQQYNMMPLGWWSHDRSSSHTEIMYLYDLERRGGAFNNATYIFSTQSMCKVCEYAVCLFNAMHPIIVMSFRTHTRDTYNNQYNNNVIKIALNDPVL